MNSFLSSLILGMVAVTAVASDVTSVFKMVVGLTKNHQQIHFA
jgi:hypothetical protein